MTEFELISRLKPLLPGNDFLVAGAGDDCAVLDVGIPEEFLLLKTDAVVEGIHYTPDVEPERVGRKAMGRFLSDIAAMGGSATAALITLALPRPAPVEWVERMYRGAAKLASRFQVAIAGGETVRTNDRVVISVSGVGRIRRDRMVRRNGARPGDAIFVTGELGGSIHGHHLDFEPRLMEGAWLVSEFKIHSMMDVSDGIAGDLPHILEASGGLGADLLARTLPIRRDARIAARMGSAAKPAVLAALTDGEDFELLFTVAPREAVRLLDAWKLRFPETRLSCIGKVATTPGVRLRDKDSIRTLSNRGYDHFQ